MGAYLQQLEAMHTDMIGALLGINRGGAEVAPVSAPAPTVATPAPAAARSCTGCGKRLRVDSVGGKCFDCRQPASAPATTATHSTGCITCGDQHYSRGYCKKHYQADYLARKAAGAVGRPAPKPPLDPPVVVASKLCTLCNNALRGDNLTGICSECRHKGLDNAERAAQLADVVIAAVVPPAPDTATRFREGDRVRILANKLDHPFARGDVGKVVAIEKQPLAIWYLVNAGGQGYNFRAEDLGLAS